MIINILMSCMQEIQEAKEGLLVYLEANRQYIEQTVYNVFNVQCIEQKTLQTLDIAKMNKTTKDIFDFGDNKVYQYFFSHLDNNVQNYIKQQYANKAAKDFYLLDVEKLTDIVKFCILHGFDFEAARRKDQEKKKAEQAPPPPPPPAKPQPKPQTPPPPPPKSPPKPKQPERPIVPIFHEPIPVFEKVKPRISTHLDPNMIAERKQFKLEKFSMPQKKVLPRYMMSVPKAQTIPKQDDSPPAVAPIDESYLIAHKKSIKDRLLKLFQFYCSQQANLGARPTFDHIKGQNQLMSLGKFMQFCQYTKVFYCKEIAKEMLMIQFKKKAQGKIEIDFETFQRLVQQVDQKYLKILEHDPINNPVPTYEARLMLNEPTKLGQLKKDRHLVFGTRNKEGREKLYKASKSARYETKELTGHSGRFSEDLQSGIKLKSLDRETQKPKAKKRKARETGSINLADLTRLRLPKLPWIDEEQEPEAKVRFGKKII